MNRPNTDTERDYSARTVSKAIELLETLMEIDTEATLSQLSSQVGLSRRATLRVVRSLCDRGLVERDQSGRHYRLGVNAVLLAQKMLNSMNVIAHAHPVLEALARRHHEAAYLTVCNQGKVLFLDMAECKGETKEVPLVGQWFPCFSNAAGKVMKSLESQDLIEKMFKKRGRKRHDAPSLDLLERELRSIRDQGVAVDRGGLGEGIISVAVAVKDYTGKVIGALTLIGPSFRMLADRLDKEIIPSLKVEAELLSGKFGYAPA